MLTNQDLPDMLRINVEKHPPLQGKKIGHGKKIEWEEKGQKRGKNLDIVQIHT